MQPRIDLTTLARRVELALAEHAGRARPGRAEGVEVLEVGGARAVWLGAGSPFSAVIGLGLRGEVEPEDLDRVEAHLGRDGAPVRVELASPADGSVAAELGARRYAVRAFRQAWVRELEAPGQALPVERPPRSTLQVREIDPCEEGPWDEAIARSLLGLAAGQAGPLLAGVPARAREEGEGAFVALDGAEVAGAALVTASDGVALLASAGVLPAHRGRGTHAALVSARLDWARRRGCDLAAAVTVAGSSAERSLERCGFRCAYPRAVLVGPARRIAP